MIILACLDPDMFFKIALNAATMQAIRAAHECLCQMPWDGELHIPTEIECISTREKESATILIDKVRVTVVRGLQMGRNWKFEDFLEYPDNILELPDLYLTRRFRLLQNFASKYLSLVEEELIQCWEAKNGKTVPL